MLKDGYINDFATNKAVDLKKPEEKVRQEYEKILYDDYFYDKEQLDIEVSIQMGSAVKKADIVIYKNKSKNRNQYSDILGIVEVKKKSRKDGLEQLTSYMQATSALFGVWTNGEEIEYLYKNSKGEVKKDCLFNIPKKGETIEAIGNITKDKLKPVKNLKPVFRRILNTLYSNTNISRKEKLGSEMIKLIFCKIIDEKYELDSLPNFRITTEEMETINNDKSENEEIKIAQYGKVKKRIQKLFIKVKEELEDDGIFITNEEITLDAKSIVYVVGELEQIALLKTEKDIVGEAFETFAESKLVGEKGEFFTPREIVKLAVQILDPSPNQTIIDPACGSGGFLIYALEHVWKKMDHDRTYKNSTDINRLKKQIAEKCFYGLEKEIDLVKICKAYMTIIGDGKSKIVQENTLHPIHEFQVKTKELITTQKDGEIELNTFDFVVTNPPFGSKIKVLKEDCKYFELGHQYKKEGNSFIRTNKVKETEPQELFIERCLQLLKDGGKLAIVLPETYLHAPSKKHVLDFLVKENNIIAVIDLPHNTFRPYCNAKTCLLVLEKGKRQNSDIIMAVAEEMGHDHTGRLIYRYDSTNEVFTKEIWDDTETIRNELLSKKFNKNTFITSSSDITNNVYVPRYYWKKKEEEIKEIANNQKFKLITINELLKQNILQAFNGHGSPPSEYKGTGTVPYVRVADIINWEIYKNPTALVPEHIYHKIKGKNGLSLQQEDVVFVRRGSYRIGSVAMISKFDTNVLLTNEITTFRIINQHNIYNITSYYFLFAMSHSITQKQLYNKIFIDTTLPNIGDRWKELLIPIPLDRNKTLEISNKIKDTFTQKWQALDKLSFLRDEFGDIVT
ncbi:MULTISPECIES: N-6 DNA methylase [Rickettsieae]|uniref:N-6 DNA methylase n=1 Tax=Rickettsieae TaxID=33988 RepID=UPI000B9C0F32|nr:N-6 DNA methylase [Rickettsia endosymbiont of Culicoides newsteadi]OZG32112.1 restriction endonuclease subunit M [Rickettsia endosymbiont of Culicoides newsteadi]